MTPSAFHLLREMTHTGAVSLRIRGVCMAPVLADKETVPVRARRFYFPGDVLVFRTKAGELAAHRMLGWRGAGLVTKGDGCMIHDAPVAAEAIVGAVDLPVPLRDRVHAIADFAGIVGRRLGRLPR